MEAQQESVSVVSEAQARQLSHTLTHKSLFSSRGEMSKSPGLCSTEEEEEAEASHALTQGPPHLGQMVSGQFLGPTQQRSNCWHPNAEQNESLLGLLTPSLSPELAEFMSM